MAVQTVFNLTLMASILALAAGMPAADDESAFRASVEARKNRLLAAARTQGRVMTTSEQIDQAKRNVRETDWGRDWFSSRKEVADFVAAQTDSYIDSMVPELTPDNPYGFTCPNCVGKKSQEGVGTSIVEWDYRRPDVIRCTACGQVYPDPKYPEQGRLECPRTGQTFTYYITDAERASPDDQSGQYAWHWVGRPIRVSFEGIIRHKKAHFAGKAVETLADAYNITGDDRYARAGIKLITRLAQCYRKWLYHDYWSTFADCDPLYAAWHDSDLPRAWKRNASEDAFRNDKPGRAAMLQGYWGAGRIHPSTDSVSMLAGLCAAYDSLRPLMTSEQRTLVERDLLLEWIIGAEPYVGGEGKAGSVNNKSPRIYNAMAAVGKCLDIPDFVDTALRGYEGIRDASFLYDGFSNESPSYTNMYLSELVDLTDVLQGYQWPSSYAKRSGTVDLYGTDPRLKLMFRTVVDQLRGDGRYLPLSDTEVNTRPSPGIVETGLKRYPEYFLGAYSGIRAGGAPGGYSVYNLDDEVFKRARPLSPPETVFPSWMTAVLRGGSGPKASVAALPFSPWGGHRHTDNLGLYYSDRGDAVLDELGYVGDMPTKPWAGNTLSHNLVIVDDSQQLGRGRAPRFELMATTPCVSVVEASAAAYKQCSDYRRLVALIKEPDGQTFAVDIFRVTGGRKHAYQVRSELASSEADGSALVPDGLALPPEPPLPEIGASIRHEDLFGLRDIRTDADPPASWQAAWKQSDRSYRLWMLSQVDRVEASNGPGQTTRANAGRRARYLNSIRQGDDDLCSTFVAVHEPSGVKEMPIKQATRLDVPGYAGRNAAAVRIESRRGVYYVLSEFDSETSVEGISFRGRFGVVCDPASGRPWAMAVGASTLQRGRLGFSGKCARWTGQVARVTDSGIETSTPKPADWPLVPKGCGSYAGVDTGDFVTGFKTATTGPNTIGVDRFPVPTSAKSFDWLALRFLQSR